ncbi:TPA: hypothetical protein ACGBIE_003767 [Yersinia enterocolitica]
MSEIKQLKRFIYSAMVTSGSGSQSFYIDAESREEAGKRAANKESDGMYAEKALNKLGFYRAEGNADAE